MTTKPDWLESSDYNRRKPGVRAEGQLRIKRSYPGKAILKVEVGSQSAGSRLIMPLGNSWICMHLLGQYLDLDGPHICLSLLIFMIRCPALI